ncbi:MAG: TIGR01777 family oxidoreductase [Flavobacteriales bacterium]
MKRKKIIIAGANGFLGKLLVGYFSNNGHQVLALVRNETTIPGCKVLLWDGKNIGEWAKEFNHADVLINMAGKSVDCRYTKANKEGILNSRIESTLALGAACVMADAPPELWINASSATIYESNTNLPFGEDGTLGNNFSEQVCKEWEKTFNEIPLPGTRKVGLRLAMVFGDEGGVFQVLKQLVKVGLGGRMGDGGQFVSWIHQHDFLRSLEFIMKSRVEGTINVCAPTPEKNEQMMRILRDLLSKKIGIHADEWMLEIGAFVLRTETELVLKSRNVIPKKLQQLGFSFRYPNMDKALLNLVS